MGKLQNEFKLTCAENEELKRRLIEAESISKKTRSEGDNKLQILTQECERLNSLVEKRNSEIRAMGGEVQDAQEKIRLSSQQTTKLNFELNEVRQRYDLTSQ